MQTLLPTSPLMLLLLLCLLCGEMMVGVVQAYPDGPPIDACTHMFPTGHHADAMSVAPPYTLTASVSGDVLAAGATVTVILATTGDANYPYYEGMFVQARKADCSSDVPLGTFSIPANDNFMKLMNCNGSANSAVAHKVKEHITTKTFTWTVPAQNTGRIYFRATVVKNEKTFWTNVFSNYLTYAGDSSQPPAQYCAVQTSSAPAMTSSIMAALLLSVLGFWCTS